MENLESKSSAHFGPAEAISFLNRLDVSYHKVEHPAVFTCEESSEHVPELSGIHTKNLFLRDKPGARHFLVVVDRETRVDLKALAKAVGVKKLSLGSAERLQQYLGLTPGSVSILGVLNDPEGFVELIIDKKIWQAEALCCHPLINTSTISIPLAGVRMILAQSGHQPLVLNLSGTSMGSKA